MLWGVGCTVLLSILVPGIILYVVFSKTTDAVEGAFGSANGVNIQMPNMPNVGVGTQSNQPIECVGAGSVIRTNAEVNVPTGPAVIVRDGCQLRLVNTDVRGKDGIRVEGSGEVTMLNGSVTVDGTAVFASGGSITFTNVELGGKNGIATEGDAFVELVNGAIRGDQLAIEARGQSRVHLSNTNVVGGMERDPDATILR